ncbi:MAG: sigma-70 family RNA polymerase sigma factor [Muribaculaceae bacterium]|nr:sigma-70 family RNA polymerase sigma factor [Muribaculaceae bacterium]
MVNITFDISPVGTISVSGDILFRLRRFLSRIIPGNETERQREETFSAIIRDHGNIISGICFSYSDNREDMKDLRQDIMLNIWKGLSNFRGESSLTTWLYRVALNTCVSTVRKKSGRVSTVGFDDIGDMADEDDVTSERLAMLHSMISTLSPLDKAIITMWLDERNYEEIAEVTGISRNNVAVRINRIKKRLAAGYSEEF